MTNVSDETKQQVLNQIDDCLPETPPYSPPYSPTSPEYSPALQSPIMEYPDWASETTCTSANTTSEDENDEPLLK
jgi:hypothetical protein